MELAAFIIALVAFIMVIPFFFQLIFGKPKIRFTFGYDDNGGSGRLLKIYLTNDPRNRLLQSLRIPPLSVEGFYLVIQVWNVSTKELIVDLFKPNIGVQPSDTGTIVNLPPSILMRSVELVKWQISTNSAVLIGNSNIPLSEGVYLVRIGFELRGELKEAGEATFHVGKTETEIVWGKVKMRKARYCYVIYTS